MQITKTVRLTEPDGWGHEVTVDVTFGVKDATAHR